MLRTAILVFASLLLFDPAASAQQAKPNATKTPAKKPAARKPVRRRFTPAQTRIETERIKEIQNALIRERLLEGPATGKWDKPTEQAMSAYQKQNAFRVTGKPDAKSLKKLGL